MGESEPDSRGRVGTEAVLAHFGKRGMHWGQRKSSSDAGSLDELRKSLGVKSYTIGPKGTEEILTIPNKALPKHHGPPMIFIHGGGKMPEGHGIRLANGDELIKTNLGKLNFGKDSSNYIPVTKTERSDMNAALKRENKQHMKQSDPVEDFLAHVGVRGMHWGIRKARDTRSVSTDSGEPTSVQLYSRPGKGIIKTTGGTNRAPSDDAKTSAGYKQIARTSGTDSLSNQQLSALNTRMGLEQSYKKVAAQQNQRSKGKQFVVDTLKTEGKQLLSGKKGPLLLLAAGLLAASYAGKHRAGTRSAAKVLVSEGKRAVSEIRGSKQTKSGAKATIDVLKYAGKHTLGNSRSKI